jgi:hypothetical protein
MGIELAAFYRQIKNPVSGRNRVFFWFMNSWYSRLFGYPEYIPSSIYR